MSEVLSKLEQELLDLCEDRPRLLSLDGRIGMLAREVRQSKDAIMLPPHAMAVRVGITANVAEELEQAQAFLAALSQQLSVLQAEQIKEL